MNIVKARKNLLEHLHLLPEPVQADVEFLLEKFDTTVRELKEIKRNAASWNKIKDLPHEIWRDVVGYEGIYQVSNLLQAPTRAAISMWFCLKTALRKVSKSIP